MSLGLCACWRSRLTSMSPLRRHLATESSATRRLQSRIPPPNDKIKTPSDFLKAIGRSSEKKVPMEDWEEFWNISGLTLKGKGLGVQDRRYILWCMERYRQNFKIKEFAHEPKPPKKIRGWGPSVQNGKRLRR